MTNSNNLFFTADEHYGHRNIIKHTNRPFKTVEEMDEELIRRFNEKVSQNATTIHAGDFCWIKNREMAYKKYVNRLNGSHIFLEGSHDYWLKGAPNKIQIWKTDINKIRIVVCHYCLRTWSKSHYNSYHLYGHSHGKLPSQGKSMDIGVDTNNYAPYSLQQIMDIMETKPDNFNLVKGK